MRALFDTNILIDCFSGKEIARNELQNFNIKLISIINYIEILAGARNNSESELLKSALKDFKVIHTSQEIAEKTIEIRKIRKIKLPDAIVLATAMCEDAILVTRDIKDFPEDGITIRNPYTL